MSTFGGSRGTFAGNLTAEQAKVKLATPIALLLLGQAQLNFVGSSASSPARYVEIKPGRGCNTPPNRMLRTCRLNLKQYREAVLPILNDESNDPQTPINNVDIAEKKPLIQRYVEHLGEKLRKSFEEAGY